MPPSSEMRGHHHFEDDGNLILPDPRVARRRIVITGGSGWQIQGLLKVWIWTQVLAMCTTGPGWQWIYAWQKTRSNLAMSNTQNKNKGSCQKETFLYQLLLWKEFILVREKLKWHLIFFPFWPSVKLRKSSWHNIFLLRQRKRLDSLKKTE